MTETNKQTGTDFSFDDYRVNIIQPPAVCPKLAQKIFLVFSEIGVVPKTGYNKSQGYYYQQEVDIINAVKPLLMKHRLIVLKVGERYQNIPAHSTRSGTGQIFTELCTTFRWIDVDTGHYLDTEQIGTGIDSGDKGSYKASTGAKKYNLTTNLLIPSEDDPEADESTDKNNSAKERPVASYTKKLTAAQLYDKIVRLKDDPNKEIPDGLLTSAQNFLMDINLQTDTNAKLLIRKLEDCPIRKTK